MRLVTLAAVLAILSTPVSPLAQTSVVAVVNFEQAVVESTEGKKASDEFNKKLEERRVELEKLQQELTEAENTLGTQERALSEARRLELTRDIDRRRTALTRANEDAEREFTTLRDSLLQPIAANASVILRTFAAERNITVLIDLSAPTNNVLYVNEANNITADFIRRLNEEAAKKAATPQPPPRP